MSWRDELQTASFRGVHFLVNTHSYQGGRRLVSHAYPLRDNAYIEDLGKKTPGHSVEAFVVGENYMPERDALLEALEKKGSGVLVHPYLGQVRVQVDSFNLRESNAQGGIATFSINFIQSDEQSRPISLANTPQQVVSRADIALSIVQQQFNSNYSLTGLPGWVTDEAATVLSHLDNVLSGLVTADSLIGDYVTVPDTISTMLLSRLSTFSSLNQYRKLFTFGSDLSVVPSTTPSRIQQASNQVAIINMVQQTAMIEATKKASSQSYASHNEAIAVRSELAEVLDQQMLTADDESYVVLQDLRAAIIEDLTERSANLKQIKTYTPQSTLPSLVIAHQLYQDANRETDIVSRNHIGHPGFVLGGMTLEVLDA